MWTDSVAVRRIHVIAAAAGAAVSLAVSAAAGQVRLTQSQFEAGVNFAAFFDVERGCGSSATTSLRVSIPTDVAVVELPEKPGWSLRGEREGGRVSAVTWERQAAVSDPDRFGLLVKLPPRQGPLYFAAVQRCGTAEIRWTDVPPGPMTHPAPMLTLIAAPTTPRGQHSGATIAIERPWARATPPGAQTAAAYLTIANHGNEEDVLIGASSPMAERVEFHETTTTGGVMRMRPATRGVAVPAHGTVELKADGGYHVMLSGLKAPLRSGTMLPITLRFAKAGSIEALFAVEPIGARGPSTGATDHTHH
jgi:copper(I)-binding protein